MKYKDFYSEKELPSSITRWKEANNSHWIPI